MDDRNEQSEMSQSEYRQIRRQEQKDAVAKALTGFVERVSKDLTEDMLKRIEELKESDYVKLARKEKYLQYKQRSILYSLQREENRGRKLAAMGYTLENIEEAFGVCQVSDYPDEEGFPCQG